MASVSQPIGGFGIHSLQELNWSCFQGLKEKQVGVFIPSAFMFPLLG